MDCLDEAILDFAAGVAGTLVAIASFAAGVMIAALGVGAVDWARRRIGRGGGRRMEAR